MSAFVEIVRNDGSSERLPFEEREVMLGRSANVQLSLPSESELDLEHVLFVPQGHRGCWVSCAERVTNPLLLRGEPFSEGMVPWGTEFKVGSLILRIETGSGKRSRLPKIDPKVVIAAMVVAGFVVWSQLRVSGGDIDSPRELTAPSLFASLPGCSVPHDALVNAHRAEQIAHSRGDRYAYDPFDGVQAVFHYAEAEACYREAGSIEDADRVASYKERLRARVEADYATSRTRLLQAIETRRWDEVMVEARRLIALTSNVDETENNFVAWVHRVKRQASAKVSHGR